MGVITPLEIRELSILFYKEENEIIICKQTLLDNIEFKCARDANMMQMYIKITVELEARTEELDVVDTRLTNYRMLRFSQYKSKASIDRLYLLNPSNKVTLKNIHSCIGNAIDTIQETLNVLFKNEISKPIVAPLLYDEIKDRLLKLVKSHWY